MVVPKHHAPVAGIDKFLERAAHSHFMQSSAWLDAFCDDGESIRHVLTEVAGDIVACSGVRRVRGLLTGEKCFVDGGPVFDDLAGLERHLGDLLPAMSDCIYLRLRPYLPAADGVRLRELLHDHGFLQPPPEEQSGYVNTLVLDLWRPMAELEADFSQHLRRNLRRAARSGLTIERATDTESAAQFAGLLERAAAAAGYAVPSSARVAAFLRKLCESDGRAGALFCARAHGRLRAGIVVLRAAHSLVYQWGARDEAAEDSAPVTHALHVEAIGWGQAQSFRHYDFGGLFSPDGMTGIDRFKRSFGGNVQAQFGEAVRRRGMRGWIAGRRRRMPQADRKEMRDAAAS